MEINPLDKYITEAVKKKRETANMTQYELSLSLNRHVSFVAQVESSSKRDKYNIYHLNKLAQIFNCSIADFFPIPFLEYDEELYNPRKHAATIKQERGK